MENPGGPLDTWPDRELVVAFKGGVPEAYDEMYRRYSDRVRHVCHRMLGSPEDAREATQETFLKAYVALPRFNGQYQLGAWLSRIATNVCVDHLRRRARSAPITPWTESHDGTRIDLGPEDVVVRDIPALSTLETLQPLHARALDLRNLQGLSHKEIAVQLDMTPNQVKALLHRARLSFKRAWENASGWALAPLVGLRHMLHQSSKDVSDLSVQLPAWTQAAGPLVIEKVAASVIVVAIAISGATGSTPTSPRAPAASGSESLAQAARSRGIDAPAASTTQARKHGEAPTLAADVGSLLADVRKTAEDQTSDKRSRDKDDRHGEGPVDPTNPDRASQKVVKKVSDAADDALPDLPDR